MFKHYKYVIVVSLSILAVALVFVFFMQFISINHAIDVFNRHYIEEAKKVKDSEWIATSDSEIASIQLRKAYYTSHLETVKQDSIALLLDFPDSSATLLIKGVAVHRAKMSDYTISNFFDAVNPVALYQMLSAPLKVTRHKSTIRKVPLMIKIAPKDTSEYTPDIIPDTSDVDLVNFILETNSGLQLYFYESNPKESADEIKQLYFELKDRVRKTCNTFTRAFAFKKPDYKPYIRIKMAKKDAKIIYRAIPENALIVVKFK
ncbi:MAG: hypothetical protein AB7S54_11915 [Bacteroidales bacterium]